MNGETASMIDLDRYVAAARVLIVGGSADDTAALHAHIRDFDVSNVSIVADTGAALHALAARAFDLIILDVMQSRAGMVEFFKAIAVDEVNRPAILMTAAPDGISRAVQCIKWGADDTLTRPYEPTMLRARIRVVLDRRRLRAVAHANPASDALQSDASNRFVPREFLDHLERRQLSDVRLGDNVSRRMTVFFSDIRDFTMLSEAMTPQENFNFINSYLRNVNPIVRSHRGFIDKYIGDAIMALFPNATGDALDASIALQVQMRKYNQGRIAARYPPIRVGIGLHCGDLILGTIGETDRMQTTVISDAVNVAARIEGLTKIFGCSLLVSAPVVEGLARAANYKLRALGAVRAKGKTSRVDIFECYENDPPDLLEHKMATSELFANALEEFQRGLFITAGRLFQRIAAGHAGDGPATYYRDRCSTIVVRGTGPGVWDGAEFMETK
jgi:two-component system sensor histidine kinase ChiS